MIKQLFVIVCLILPLVGCFEANDESGIKRTFCKDVPIERYQQYIGVRSQFQNISRDSVARQFKEEALRKNHTCLQELDMDELITILLGGALFIGAAMNGH